MATGPTTDTARGAEARRTDALVLEHLPIVRQMALRLARRLPPHVEREELVSAGVVGLMEAARRYDARLGVPFSAYLRRRVHGAMLDALRALDEVPRGARRLRRRLDGCESGLRASLGREPRASEVAAALGLTDVEFDAAVAGLRVAESSSVRLADADADPPATAEDPAAAIERRELSNQLAGARRGLPLRERRVLALSCEGGLTLAEIGRHLGLCESRVCQLRMSAIHRLRGIMAAPPVPLVAAFAVADARRGGRP